MKTAQQSGVNKKWFVPLFVVLILFASSGVYLKLDHPEVVSEFGKYKGFSEAVYDGTQRTSDYLTLSDGTRLAYDLIIPRRLTIRPTDHSQVSAKRADLDYGAEALRWLDYWLKGIENGIMDEPPIHYYVQDGPKRGTWQTSDQWPLATQIFTPYYFGQGKSGTIDSVNDGVLLTTHPESASSPDDYTVDYSTTTGTKSRWGAVETAHKYPDLRQHDAKALTYTTQPLVSGVEVTGHPVIHLWLTSDAPDLDVFVYLEGVDRNGRSTYIAEGILRASHRKLSEAPFNNLGLPYQTHFKIDQEPILSGTPTELVFSLLHTSYQFHSGNRIRITVAFCDAGNFDTPVLDPRL